MITEQDHRITQVGKDLRTSQVQPPVHSSTSCGVRAGCLGLYPVRSLKSPRLEMIPSGISVPQQDCPCWEKNFPYIQSEPLLFQLTHIISYPPAMHLSEEPGCLLSNLPIGTGKLLWGPPEAISSPGLKVLLPQHLLIGQVFHPLTSLVASSELTPVCCCFSCPEWTKLNAVS